MLRISVCVWEREREGEREREKDLFKGLMSEPNNGEKVLPGSKDSSPLGLGRDAKTEGLR